MRVAIDFLKLRCVRPAAGSVDRCYVFAAGAVDSGTRIVRVHPEEKISAEHSYSWPMEAGQSRDLRVRMAAAELSDFQTMTLRLIAAARVKGNYASALMFAAQIAQSIQSQGQMASTLGMVSHMPDQFNGDLLLGEFMLMVTNTGKEVSHWGIYSPTAEPLEAETKGDAIALKLTGNRAEYEIVFAVRAPVPSRR
jgi:hypothetical protein